MACFQYIFLNLLIFENSHWQPTNHLEQKGQLSSIRQRKDGRNRELHPGLQGHPQPKIHALLDHFLRLPVKEPSFLINSCGCNL